MRKILSKVLTLFLIFTFALSSHLLAKNEDTLSKILKRGKLVIGTEAGYVPFEMTHKNGKIIGFDIDLARHMAKKMGVKLEVVNTNYDGIIPALYTKKFDIIISAMTVTQGRNLKVNFADPYILVGQTVLLNKRLKGKVKSYKDLNNPKYTVVSKLGTTGEKAVKRLIPRAKYLSFENQQEGVLEVLNNKADAFIYDLPMNTYFYASQGKGRVIHLDKPFTFEPLAWAVRKGDYDFLNFLNNYLRQIKNDGTYDRIYKKWFKSDKWLNSVR